MDSQTITWTMTSAIIARASTIMMIPKKISQPRQLDFSTLVDLAEAFTVLYCFGLTLVPAGFIAGFLAGLALVVLVDFVFFAVVGIEIIPFLDKILMFIILQNGKRWRLML